MYGALPYHILLLPYVVVAGQTVWPSRILGRPPWSKPLPHTLKQCMVTAQRRQRLGKILPFQCWAQWLTP